MARGVYERKQRKPLEERFWEKVDKYPTDPIAREKGCWLWLASCRGAGSSFGNVIVGRPSIRVGDKKAIAARVSYEIAHGVALLPTVLIRHTCDNHMCVNPSHLIPGTAADNARDASSRGRLAQRLPGHRLATDVVRAIHVDRLSGYSILRLSEKYRVATSTASRVVNGVFWRNVYEEFHGAQQEQVLGNVA